MKLKRISLRFNLENESDRRAWERLQDLSGSKNKAIISAINGYFEQENDLAETIRETIMECLRDMSVVQTQAEKKKTNLWIPSICFSAADGIRVVPLFYALKCPAASL